MNVNLNSVGVGPAGSSYEETGRSSDMRNKIRNLDQSSDQNRQSYTVKTVQTDSGESVQVKEVVYSGTIKEKESGFLDLTSSSTSEVSELDKNLNYNSGEVEQKIRAAKNSISAGRALLSASRKVREVKRKLVTGDGDPAELQISLSHARRIEIVARKKKHHLELEELVEVTSKRDERLNEQEDIREERSEGAIAEVSEEAMIELNEKIASFGEDELLELEKTMEIFEEMEVVDPHMSKEELAELKRKHRASEEREMIKADMDYLKAMVKYQSEKMSQAAAAIGVGRNVSADVMGFITFEPVSSGINVTV